MLETFDFFTSSSFVCCSKGVLSDDEQTFSFLLIFLFAGKLSAAVELSIDAVGKDREAL